MVKNYPEFLESCLMEACEHLSTEVMDNIVFDLPSDLACSLTKWYVESLFDMWKERFLQENNDLLEVEEYIEHELKRCGYKIEDNEHGCKLKPLSSPSYWHKWFH